MCSRGEDLIDMVLSEEAALVIKSAFLVVTYERDAGDPYLDAELEMARVVYKHALRRLKLAYPGELCGLSEHSAKQMVHLMVRLRAAGKCIPAAEEGADRVGYNLAATAVGWLLKCEGRPPPAEAVLV